jgi:hypothetical protein
LHWILNSGGAFRRVAQESKKGVSRMMRLFLAFVVVLGAALPASAECYADYKAKQDNPLRLHYGVAQVSDAACANPKSAKGELSPRLAADGWTVLTVLSTFGPEGLGERKASAGEYFLRY